jgi:outer membrane protein insertion porin family
MRFMLGAKDYLTVFGDLGYTEKKELTNLNPNWHLGLGCGINFQTKAGIFSLFLAVGKSNESNFDFRNTKVHISYINTF